MRALVCDRFVKLTKPKPKIYFWRTGYFRFMTGRLFLHFSFGFKQNSCGWLPVSEKSCPKTVVVTNLPTLLVSQRKRVFGFLLLIVGLQKILGPFDFAVGFSQTTLYINVVFKKLDEKIRSAAGKKPKRNRWNRNVGF